MPGSKITSRSAAENILIYPIGKKVEKAVRKEGYEPQGSYQSMIDKPDYQAAAGIGGTVDGDV